MNSASPIPIENIYYLFCYAWNRFEEAKSIPLGGSPSPDLPNLLAKVLLHGTCFLFRRGLDRNYRQITEEIATVRGRIDLGQTLQLQARSLRRLVCESDDLSQDLLHNQIIKASLKRLGRAPSIDPALAHDLHALAQRMGNVTDIRLERSAFSRVQLHRNNAYYDLVLKIAELAFDSLLPDRNGDGLAFHDVLRDEGKMAKVFEDFVRNFYRTEQSTFVVAPLSITWAAQPIAGTGAGRLPVMITDIYLKSAKRRIIIDTKYYANALQRSFHGTESFHSGNLYQLFAYLKNAAAADPDFETCEGMLLYPRVNGALRESFNITGHYVTIATIDLAQPWQMIRHDLRELLMPRSS